jgi:hypothetical protein
MSNGRNTFVYGSVRLGQGRENAKLFLEQNTVVTKEIRQQIMIKKGLVEVAKSA